MDMSEVAAYKSLNLVMALVSPKDLEFGMSRMYEMMTEDTDFETFVCRIRGEAEKWISNKLKNT